MTQVDDYYNQMAARPCSGPGKGRGDRPSVRSLSIDTSLIIFRNLDSGQMRMHVPKSCLSGSNTQSKGLMSDYYGRICSVVRATSNDILFDPIRHIASEKIGCQGQTYFRPQSRNRKQKCRKNGKVVKIYRGLHLDHVWSITDIRRPRD